jgi:hypothetical protein
MGSRDGWLLFLGLLAIIYIFLAPKRLVFTATNQAPLWELFSLWENNRGECFFSPLLVAGKVFFPLFLSVFVCGGVYCFCFLIIMTKAIEELCGKMTLTEGESVGLTISKVDTADLRVQSGRCLVGKLLLEYYSARSFSLVDVQTLEDGGQNSIQGDAWESLAYWILFLIEGEAMAVWSQCIGFEGCWWRNSSFKKKNGVHVIFWVQMHELPLVCMTREIGQKIWSTLGMVEEVDVSGVVVFVFKFILMLHGL